MLKNIAEAQEALDGAIELVELAANEGIELSKPMLWMITASLRDCAGQIEALE